MRRSERARDPGNLPEFPPCSKNLSSIIPRGIDAPDKRLHGYEIIATIFCRDPREDFSPLFFTFLLLIGIKEYNKNSFSHIVTIIEKKIFASGSPRSMEMLENPELILQDNGVSFGRAENGTAKLHYLSKAAAPFSKRQNHVP